MNVNIKKIEDGIIPEYKTIGASGADCFARIYEPVILKPMERKLIPLGFAVEIPEGYEMQIRPRSGLAHKEGITVLNTPGTIDSDYRGEVHANIINLSNKDVEIVPEERVAQVVICPVIKVELNAVTELSETERGVGGHGSTGK